MCICFKYLFIGYFKKTFLCVVMADKSSASASGSGKRVRQVMVVLVAGIVKQFQWKQRWAIIKKLDFGEKMVMLHVPMA